MKRLRSSFIPICLRRRGISGFASASPPIAPLLAMTDFFERKLERKYLWDRKGIKSISSKTHPEGSVHKEGGDRKGNFFWVRNLFLTIVRERRE